MTILSRSPSSRLLCLAKSLRTMSPSSSMLYNSCSLHHLSLQDLRLPFSLGSARLFGTKFKIGEDAKTHKFIHRLFCLPFLPAEQSLPLFATILALDTFAVLIPHSLRQLLDYILNTWVHSTTPGLQHGSLCLAAVSESRMTHILTN